MKYDDRIIGDMAHNNLIDHQFVALKGAKELLVGSPIIIRQNNKNDIISTIENPNDRYYAAFDFVFSSGGIEIKRERSYVLPSSINYLVAFGQDNNTDPLIQVENIAWRRINQHVIPDWEEYKASRLNFEITNTEIRRPDGLDRTDSENINFIEVRFKVKNKTAYNYANPKFFVALKSGYGICGINEYTINNFQSGEERESVINWPFAPADAQSVEIIPNIDILDVNVYKKFDSDNKGGEKNR
jgi:hypothetical protein